MDNLRLEVKGGKSKIDGIDDCWGKITIKKDKTNLGTVDFGISAHQISIDNITIYEPYQRQGYGTIAIDFIKGYSRLMRKPIVLYSLEDSVKFYLKHNFKFIKDVAKNKTVIILYDSNNKPKIEDRDMIWLPECFNFKKEIRVEL